MSKKTLQFGAYLERIFINNMVKNKRQKKAKIDGSATIISCKIEIGQRVQSTKDLNKKECRGILQNL
ncbi:MAG: hypothetical protein ACP5N0_13880 [Methanosarcina sp.]